MEVRKSFTHDIRSREPIFHNNWDFNSLGVPNDKSRLFKDMNDYLRINDFYSKSKERYLKSKERYSYRDGIFVSEQTIDDIALMKLNKECLELAEDALKNVNWSKYK